MDFHGVVTLTLMQLPALIIGFVGGMLFMRGNYLPVIRWLRSVIRQQQRDMRRYY